VSVVLRHGYTRDDPSMMTVLARPGQTTDRSTKRAHFLTARRKPTEPPPIARCRSLSVHPHYRTAPDSRLVQSQCVTPDSFA